MTNESEFDYVKHLQEPEGYEQEPIEVGKLGEESVAVAKIDGGTVGEKKGLKTTGMSPEKIEKQAKKNMAALQAKIIETSKRNR